MNIEDLKGCFANVNDDNLLRGNGLLYAENKELKQEIERLNNIIKTKDEGIKAFTEDLCETTEELEKANNIIDELEKTLKELIKEQEDGYKKYPENWEERTSVSNTWLRSRDCYLCIYNYLQELKGVDKE